MEGLGTGLLLFAERSVCNDPLDLVQSSSMLSVTLHCATLPHHSDWSIIGGQAREGDHLMAPSRPLPTLFALLASPNLPHNNTSWTWGRRVWQIITFFMVV